MEGRNLVFLSTGSRESTGFSKQHSGCSSEKSQETGAFELERLKRGWGGVVEVD